jgi:hypothetical protein
MCLFSSCGNKNKDDERYDINTQNVGEFVDVAYAKEKLEPAIWGSQGYSIYYQKQSPYIYAAFGEYMLRYNISENEIDRAIQYKDGFIDSSFNVTEDGRVAVLINLWNETQQYEPQNIYLLNFNKSEAVYLADSKDNFEMEMIPEDIRNDFNIESIFNGSNHDNNLEIVNYNIEYDAKDNRYIAYVRYNNLLSHEITVLKGLLFSDELVGIDSKTIFTLIPTNKEENGLLGYYKFVLIDVEQDKIIQECPINIK